jgi:hypothetical protein
MASRWLDRSHRRWLLDRLVDRLVDGLVDRLIDHIVDGLSMASSITSSIACAHATRTACAHLATPRSYATELHPCARGAAASPAPALPFASRDATTPSSTRCDAAPSSTPCSSRAIAWRWAHADASQPLALAAPAPSSACSQHAEPRAVRQRAEPWTGQSRSLVSSSALHACHGGCARSPRGQTRPPRWTPLCLCEDPRGHASGLLSRACLPTRAIRVRCACEILTLSRPLTKHRAATRAHACARNPSRTPRPGRPAQARDRDERLRLHVLLAHRRHRRHGRHRVTIARVRRPDTLSESRPDTGQRRRITRAISGSCTPPPMARAMPCMPP